MAKPYSESQMLNRKKFCVILSSYLQHKERLNHPGWCTGVFASVKTKPNRFSLCSGQRAASTANSPTSSSTLHPLLDKGRADRGGENYKATEYMRPVLFQWEFGGHRADVPQYINLHMLGDISPSHLHLTATQ